ncbi:hypothetical protein D9M72_336280 [compost metagenome]
MQGLAAAPGERGLLHRRKALHFGEHGGCCHEQQHLVLCRRALHPARTWRRAVRRSRDLRRAAADAAAADRCGAGVVRRPAARGAGRAVAAHGGRAPRLRPGVADERQRRERQLVGAVLGRQRRLPRPAGLDRTRAGTRRGSGRRQRHALERQAHAPALRRLRVLRPRLRGGRARRHARPGHCVEAGPAAGLDARAARRRPEPRRGRPVWRLRGAASRRRPAGADGRLLLGAGAARLPRRPPRRLRAGPRPDGQAGHLLLPRHRRLAHAAGRRHAAPSPGARTRGTAPRDCHRRRCAGRRTCRRRPELRRAA